MLDFLIAAKKSELDELPLKSKDNREEQLILGLRENDEKAIQQLYKMYAPALMGIIKRIVTFDEIAEDLLQDSFVKIWKSIKMYDSSKGRLFTWMVNVARNLAIDHLRSKATSKSSKTEDIANIPSSLIDSQSQIIINTDAIGVKKLLNVLKSEQKLIVDMIYFQGYTQAQTSEILNMPLGTIKTKLRLAIQRLRQQFGGLALSI